MDNPHKTFYNEFISLANKAYNSLEARWAQKGSDDEKEMLERMNEVLSRFDKALSSANSKFISGNIRSEILNTARKLSEQGDLIGSDPSGVRSRVQILTDRLLELGPQLNPFASTLSTMEIAAQVREQEEGTFLSITQWLREAREEITKAKEEVIANAGQTKAVLDRIKIFETEVEQLVHYHSGAVLKGFFSTRAKDEKERADRWTYATWAFAIGTLGALGGFVYFYISGQITGDANWGLLGTKALFTATLGLVAKWSSKRANRHLTEESKYHRLALNMATLDPFIASLEKEQRDRIVLEVALKTFTDGTGTDSATEYDTLNLLDLAKTSIEKLGK